MLKRTLIAILFLLALAAAVLFTAMNPGEIELELGFAALQVPLGLAFILALALGWLLGLVSALPRILRLANQRRRLRSELRKTDSSAGLAVTDERS
jgi:uncharacterized integral membrane protein